jgi:transcription-repair coupling factor (superfamily II helicase)
VAELKGEEVREPAEIKLDLPLTANLPVDYVGREDLRLEAYRRLATVTTHGEVDDIGAEWMDRYGPLPAPAQALLTIGHLRAECARTGVREVAVVKTTAGLSGGGWTARMTPLVLRTSATVRLARLWPKAIYKPDTGQLVVPLPRGAEPATDLAALLGALVPAADLVPDPRPSVASPAP